MSDKEIQQNNSQKEENQNSPQSKADAWVKAWEHLGPGKLSAQETTDSLNQESLNRESLNQTHDDLDSNIANNIKLDETSNHIKSNRQDESLLEPVIIDESKIRKKLTYLFFIAFGTFLIWAFYAPIDAGVTAQGQVVVSGYRKAVQHPSGGVVREIFVADGDNVEEGQVLIKINPLTLQANMGTIESNYINILASEARLKAERFGNPIIWPDTFIELKNQKQVEDAKYTQASLLKVRRKEFIETIEAKEKQLKSLVTEEKNLSELATEGLVPRAQAEQAMRNRLEIENAINAFKSSYIKQVETDLAEAQKQHESLQLQLEAAKFDEAHASIQSPASGTIINMKVVTVGGVITSGQVLAEVVPRDAKLVVDVKVPANAIDRVKKDALVDLHFVAFNTATTPTVSGKVLKVGSDKVLPDRTKPGEPDFEYYAAQVETTEEGMKKLAQLEIKPGMPVDVVIKTGTRNFVSWLVKPISDRVTWAFK